VIDPNKKLLLVGDNPFHNISHLSQERARSRTDDPGDPKNAASLICTSMDNGADGFMFSVSETTLSILNKLNEEERPDSLHLHAIVPYAFEYVKLATQLGGIPGLARKFGREILTKNISAFGVGLRGILTAEPATILKAYLSYEISRVKAVTSKKVNLDSVLLHQLITALALDLDWLFKSYIAYLESRKITPGFNTGNFAYLVNKLNEWGVDLRKVIIAAPFNKVGFQVTPSIQECEKALASIPEPTVLAISVLAAGYLGLEEAADYIRSLPNIKGVAIGVSNKKQATETFMLFKKIL
jgi:hypothetical protein